MLGQCRPQVVVFLSSEPCMKSEKVNLGKLTVKRTSRGYTAHPSHVLLIYCV